MDKDKGDELVVTFTQVAEETPTASLSFTDFAPGKKKPFFGKMNDPEESPGSGEDSAIE